LISLLLGASVLITLVFSLIIRKRIKNAFIVSKSI
jgi:hypothetical protein